MELPAARRPLWLDLLLLGIVALGLRAVVAAQAPAPARDAFRFIDAARALEREPLQAAIRRMDVHPLFPALLLGAEKCVVAAGVFPGPQTWVRAGQLVAVITGAMGLLVAYLVGRRLLDPDVAFWGCLAAAALPRSVVYTAEVLADGPYVLFWTLALAAVVRGFDLRHAGWFAAGGIAAGLAYLVKVESLLLPVVVLALLLLAQVVPAWRRSWPATIGAVVAFLAAAALVVTPYVATIGRLTNRNALNNLAGAQGPALETPSKSPPPVALRPAAKPELPAVAKIELAPRPYVAMEGFEKASFVRALGLHFKEWQLGTRGFLLALAGIGLLAYGLRPWRWPETLLLSFSTLGLCAAMVRMQMAAGYQTCRYLLPIMPFVGMLAALGARAIIRRFAKTPRGERTIGTALALLYVASIAPWSLAPINDMRRPLLEAGAWIAAHTEAGEAVFDPTAYAAYYAERPRWTAPVGFLGLPAVRFAIIETGMVYGVEYDVHMQIKRCQERGRIVAAFPQEDGSMGPYSAVVLEITQP